MLWAVWIGLAIAVLAVAFGVYRAVRQVLELFRSLKRLRGESAKALDELTRAADRLAQHPNAGAKLEPALARLTRDRARLNVLLAAVDEVRDSVARVTFVYPRK
jgi:plasmid stabilization system protein ParE